MQSLSSQLSHLPNSKIKELEIITQRIMDTQHAEMIILFGSYARGDYKEQRGEVRGKKSDYDILIITDSRDTKKVLQKKLKNLFEDIETTVQLILENINFVNSNLKEKQYFFTDVKREGIVLFDSKKFHLATPQALTPTRRREIADDDFNQWFNDARKAYKGANFYLTENDFGWSAFCLQQTVEMCYTTIEMVFAHYNPHEHNLKALRERVLSFCSQLREVLPYETSEQIKLFDDLNFAYIGGRYRSEKEFPVTKEQLDYWSSEASKLLELTKTVCLERIEHLKEIEIKGGRS